MEQRLRTIAKYKAPNGRETKLIASLVWMSIASQEHKSIFSVPSHTTATIESHTDWPLLIYDPTNIPALSTIINWSRSRAFGNGQWTNPDKSTSSIIMVVRQPSLEWWTAINGTRSPNASGDSPFVPICCCGRYLFVYTTNKKNHVISISSQFWCNQN